MGQSAVQQADEVTGERPSVRGVDGGVRPGA